MDDWFVESAHQKICPSWNIIWTNQCVSVTFASMFSHSKVHFDCLYPKSSFGSTWLIMQAYSVVICKQSCPSLPFENEPLFCAKQSKTSAILGVCRSTITSVCFNFDITGTWMILNSARTKNTQVSWNTKGYMYHAIWFMPPQASLVLCKVLLPFCDKYDF